MTLLDWDAAGLQACLQAQWPGAQVRVVAETGSTNSDLLALGGTALSAQAPSTPQAPQALQAPQAPQAHPAPQVLLAQSQRAGRGRQGRTWISAPGASLTFSIGLAMTPRHGWGALSLVVGEAVARVLQPWPAEGLPPSAGRLMIKWPNDLWWYDTEPVTPAQRAAGAKVAGILIETQGLPGPAGQAGARWVVIGIGVNVQPPPSEALGLALGQAQVQPAAVAGTARWQPDADAAHWWHALVPEVLSAVHEFEREGFACARPAVERRELLIGQPVSLSAGAVRQGRCIGLDLDGALRIETAQGPQRVVAGEVSVRPEDA